MELCEFSVALSKIVERYNLEVLTCGDIVDKIEIVTPDVNRPGLQLCGFFDYFQKTRIQVFGKVEHTYVSGMSKEEKEKCFDALFSTQIPALIVTRGQELFEEMEFYSKK